MNKQERRIIKKLLCELALRKSEHPTIYGAWWVLSEMFHGRLGSAERIADTGLNISKEMIERGWVKRE